MSESVKPPEDVPAVSAEALVEGEVLAEDSAAEPRRYPSTIGGALYLAILAVVIAGLVVASVASWRLGIRVVSGSMIAAAVARLALPERDAGMLAVRNRWFDAAILILMGVAMIVLTASIPDQPGA